MSSMTSWGSESNEARGSKREDASGALSWRGRLPSAVMKLFVLWNVRASCARRGRDGLTGELSFANLCLSRAP